MHRIKIHTLKESWGPIRQSVFWVAFCVLLSMAAFEAGWILRGYLKDDTRERTLKLETKFTDHDGRITVLEGPPRVGNKLNKLNKRNELNEHVK